MGLAWSERNHCNGIHASVGDVERFFIRRESEAVWCGARELRRSAQHPAGAVVRISSITRFVRVDHGDPIAIVGSDKEACLLPSLSTMLFGLPQHGMRAISFGAAGSAMSTTSISRSRSLDT